MVYTTSFIIATISSSSSVIIVSDGGPSSVTIGCPLKEVNKEISGRRFHYQSHAIKEPSNSVTSTRNTASVTTLHKTKQNKTKQNKTKQTGNHNRRGANATLSLLNWQEVKGIAHLTTTTKKIQQNTKRVTKVPWKMLHYNSKNVRLDVHPLCVRIFADSDKVFSKKHPSNPIYISCWRS